MVYVFLISVIVSVLLTVLFFYANKGWEFQIHFSGNWYKWFYPQINGFFGPWVSYRWFFLCWTNWNVPSVVEELTQISSEMSEDSQTTDKSLVINTLDGWG